MSAPRFPAGTLPPQGDRPTPFDPGVEGRGCLHRPPDAAAQPLLYTKAIAKQSARIQGRAFIL
jgi:hypothetical protein